MKIALQTLTIVGLFLVIGLSMILSFNDWNHARELTSLYQEWDPNDAKSRGIDEGLGLVEFPEPSDYWIPMCFAFAMIPISAFAISAAVSLKRKLGYWIASIMIAVAAMLYWLQPNGQFHDFIFEDHGPLARLDSAFMLFAAFGLIILVVRHSPKKD